MKSLILLLIAMSAAGTFPFIIYIALSTIFDNYISARFRYRCLKYCLLLYLVPFPLLKYFIYHRYFSTDNGDIIIIEPGDIQTYAGCSHIFVNGKHKNHSRNKNGECTVKTYKGKICTKCNYTIFIYFLY